MNIYIYATIIWSSPFPQVPWRLTILGNQQVFMSSNISVSNHTFEYAQRDLDKLHELRFLMPCGWIIYHQLIFSIKTFWRSTVCLISRTFTIELPPTFPRRRLKRVSLSHQRKLGMHQECWERISSSYLNTYETIRHSWFYQSLLPFDKVTTSHIMITQANDTMIYYPRRCIYWTRVLYI